MSFEVGDKHFLFLVGVLAVVSAVGIVTGFDTNEPSVFGHSVSELAPGATGTFGAGDYAFPDNLDIGGGLDVSGNMDVGGSIGATNVGSVFVRWGSASCPSVTSFVYNGYAFGGYYGHSSSTNALCVKSGDPGTTTVSTGDLLYPSSTGDSSGGRIPPGISAEKIIKCAVCYAEGPTVEIWGTHNCPSGWSTAYRGYGMGSYYTSHATRERYCVESESFDSSVSSSGNRDLWYATSVWVTTNLPEYDSYLNKHLKCAVCVKQ